MSKIALSGNASGTGTFTIASPNSNSDRTLSLPDNSGTVATSGTSGVDSVPVGRGAGNVATNTAVGASALAANTTGLQNTAVGIEALKSNTTASENTAVGRFALRLNTTGFRNSGFGQGALSDNTTGTQNTALGLSALQSNTTAENNTAVGYQAGYSTTTGDRSVAIGSRALYSNTTANFNTAIGEESLYLNTTGASNNALGFGSLYSNTTGASNTALGHQTLNSNTTASNNTAVGFQAGYSNTTGDENVCIGTQAGYSGTTAADNTIVGKSAGYLLTTGTYNTFIGRNSGDNITTGSKNTIIGKYNGNQGGLDIRTSDNVIVISDGDGTPQIIVDGTNSTPRYFKAPYVYDRTTGGAANVTVSSGGLFERSTSSLKYKREVQDATHGLTEVLQLRPVTYKGKSQKDGETVFGGLIAEEVDAVGLTEFVAYAPDGTPDGLAYGNMVSLCIKAIQELNAKVEAQAAEIATLKGQP
jgi:hypothetical protein